MPFLKKLPIPKTFLEKKAEYAFILGWVYSVISIIIAISIFPADPSLVAIAFTTIFILPHMNEILDLRQKSIADEKNFSFRSLYRQYRDIIKVYIFLSAGIFIVYATAAIALPSFQVNSFFETQLAARGIHGGATIFSINTFWSIMMNNLIVITACFLVSLFLNDGGIFLITWNLSVWGTIFGVVARNAAISLGGNPILLFLLIMFIVGPHALLEMFSYILGAISGGVINRGFRREGFESKRFQTLFLYSIFLLFLAVNILMLGVLVETFVLANSVEYRQVIYYSYLV